MADKENQEEDCDWTEATMAAYFQGKAVAAIEEVSVRYKSFIEIGCELAAPGRKVRIIRALQDCLIQSKADRVNLWVFQYGNTICFGYYRKDCPWTLKARNFLHSVKLDEHAYHWISGLFYGYRPEEIQKYLDRKCGRYRTKTSRA